MAEPLTRLNWYVEHRLEFLRNRRDSLRARLDPTAEVDFEALREFMDVVGRIRELEQLLKHAETW